MNHSEDDDKNSDLFARLEAEMADAPDGPVVDLAKERSARSKTTGPPTDAPTEGPTGAPTEGPDGSGAASVDAPGGPSGPGLLARARESKRLPVLPSWATSRPDFVSAAGWTLGYAGHLVAYHGVRAPWYGLRLAAQSPRGAARFVGGTVRWVSDAEGEPLRQAAASKGNAGVEEYLKLSRQRDRRVRWRGLVAVAACVVGLPTALALYVLAPTWLLALSGSVVTLTMGWLGREADAPVVHRAVESTAAPKLTSDIVLRALGSLGVPAISQAQGKGKDGFSFTAPIARDGNGWRAEGDLPFGVTVTDIIDRREKLASGLRRPLGCVWPEAVADEHTGRLVLWVGDQDMSKAKQPTWPLRKSGSVDLFKPVAFGTDPRGRWVELTLMYIAGVIGAIPRMGKTFLLRLLLLIAALDARAELHTYDLKGTGDLDPVGDQVSYRHRAGDEDEDIEYALADLRELRTELRRRTKAIRGLPKDVCPESKVTSELASKQSLRLHPIVLAADECQVWFEHPEHGDEFEEICTDLVKRGPATGIVVLLATQRPDAKSLPTGISSNASARFCLKVMGQLENDMVLGTSAYKRGVRATQFAWGDKGIHYFVGEGADARIVRSVFADAPAAEAIAARGRALREKAGLLAGHAAGQAVEVDATPAFDLLTDLLAVIPADEPKVWNEVAAARLTELRPEVYGDWGSEQLTAALKPLGIRTGQVWGTTESGKGANRRGLKRADILKAVAERDGNSDAA